MARVAADARQTAPHGGFRNANRSARLDEPLFPDGRARPPDSLLMLARVTLSTTEMGPLCPCNVPVEGCGRSDWTGQVSASCLCCSVTQVHSVYGFP